MTSNSIESPQRRNVLKATTACVGAALAFPMIARSSYAAPGDRRRRYSRRCIDLLGESIVIDMLAPLTLDRGEKLARWLDTKRGLTSDELAAFQRSSISVFHHAYGIQGPSAYADAMSFFAATNGLIARYSDHFQRVDTVADIDRIKAAGKSGVLIGVQNSEHFRTLEDVTSFYNLGQRASQLTYNAQNRLASGSTDRVDGGLSDFGVSIVQEMNKIGMLVDVSHCGDQTTLDAIELSSTPIAITHSNCRALNDHPRLKTDEAIRKLAAKGGVMGVTGLRNFVSAREPTTIDDIVGHIDHVVELVGVEHVGIGSDADLRGYDALPPDQQQQLRAAYKPSYRFREKVDVAEFSHPMKMFDLTEALIRRRYSNDSIRAILGGNFRRLLQTVWG